MTRCPDCDVTVGREAPELCGATWLHDDYAAPGTGLLDWRERAHWSDRAAPCRRCDNLTHLRDAAGRPSHKVCAEALLADALGGAR